MEVSAGQDTQPHTFPSQALSLCCLSVVFTRFSAVCPGHPTVAPGTPGPQVFRNPEPDSPAGQTSPPFPPGVTHGNKGRLFPALSGFPVVTGTPVENQWKEFTGNSFEMARRTHSFLPAHFDHSWAARSHSVIRYSRSKQKVLTRPCRSAKDIF